MASFFFGRKIRIILALAIAVVLLGPVPAGALVPPIVDEPCAPDALSLAAQRTGAFRFTEDPQAADWTTWVVDADALMPAAPPAPGSPEWVEEMAELTQARLARTDDQVQAAQSFDTDAASTYWTDLMLHLIVAHSAKDGTKNPPRLARQMAMLETAMFDALVVTWKAKYCYQRLPPGVVDPALQPVTDVHALPSYPSEHAALAGVISVLFPLFYPPDEEPAGFDGLVYNITESRVIGGGNYRSDIVAGLAIGRAVANAVVAERANDGSQNTAPVVAPVGPCLWVPTPPAFRVDPVEPHWGSVTPFLMSSGSQFRPPPPPACGSADFEAQTMDVYQVSQSLTPRQKEIAEYWAGGQGTETPPGMWLHVGLNQTIGAELSTMQTVRVLSHTAVALADAAIACWDSKFTYWWERPVTTIRNSGLDPAWDSFIATPPFPGYVSGHSTFAGAATNTLAYFFPENARELSAYGTEAAMSRYYGGIHIRSDNEIGLVLGSQIAELAIAHAMIDE